MKITQEAEYAIQIVDYLVRCGKRAKAPEISEETTAPLRFTRNILQKLTRTGIINSYMGHIGGYELARSPEEISLYDVMEVTEGSMQLHRCLSGDHECTYIPDKTQCLYHGAFKEFSSDLEDKMRRFRFSCAVADRRLGEFLGWPGPKEKESPAMFSMRERGYDRDEVDAYIARLKQEYEGINAAYETIQKENESLKMQLGEQSYKE